jgi:signal peptidase I
MNELTKKVGHFLLEITQTIVLALSLFVVCYLFLFQIHSVNGSSMFPNFHNGDLIITDKLSYRFNPPKRFDVIVIKAPPSEPCSEDKCEYIKRLIGLPNDRILLTNSQIFINEQPMDQKFLSTDVVTKSGTFLPEGVVIQLKDNEYLVMGDNRTYSRDGREFGPINRNAIIGKAFLRIWPPSSFGLIKHY